MSKSGYRLLTWLVVIFAIIQAIATFRQTEWPIERWIGAW